MLQDIHRPVRARDDGTPTPPGPTGGRVTYVLAEPPGLSQTFVLGELLRLRAAGVEVGVLALRPSAPGAARQPAAAALEACTTTCPSGPGARRALLRAAATCLATSGRAWWALSWALGWSLRQRRTNELARFGQACWLLRSGPLHADRLHAHFAHGPASAALLLARLTGIPFSFTAHARDVFELSDERMLRQKLRSAARVVAISAHGRARLVALAPEAAARVCLVRNGVERCRFVPPAGTTPPAERPFSVVTVCRLVPKKGVDVLLASVACLRRAGFDVPCEVVGDGPAEAALRAQARELGVDDLVTFAGARDSDEVVQALHRAAVFVLPCRVDENGDQDGLPVSIVEAMAAGLPVVSTGVAGVPEVVVSGTSGVLVPPDDAPALAAALLRLRDDRELRARLGEGALATAGEFDHRAWALRLQHVLLGEGPCGSRRDRSSTTEVRTARRRTA